MSCAISVREYCTISEPKHLSPVSKCFTYILKVFLYINISPIEFPQYPTYKNIISSTSDSTSCHKHLHNSGNKCISTKIYILGKTWKTIYNSGCIWTRLFCTGYYLSISFLVYYGNCTLLIPLKGNKNK